MSPVFQSASDEELQKMAIRGDRAAEEALILRYSRIVRVCARPLFLAGGDSEDLIQEGFLGLLDAIREFRDDRDAAFGTFAQTCIRNRLHSAIRSAERVKHQPLNASLSWDSHRVDGETASSLSPEDLFIAREERAEELARLSPLEREVLSHYLKGLSYEEIAQVTSRPVKSVDNAVQRIRRKLGRP